MVPDGQRLELTVSAPACLQPLLDDEDIQAFSLSADGEVVLDHLRGHRYKGPALGEAGYDQVAEWVDEHPGAHCVRHGAWRLFLSLVEEGLIYGERLPPMHLTLDDLYHLGWFQTPPASGLRDALAHAVFIRVSGVPLWGKTLLALAIQNSLKAQVRPILGPGPWNAFDMDDDGWARTLAAKTATGAELLVTASGHLANQALQSGLKTLWAPHPAYVDEKTSWGHWPVLDVALWRDSEGQLRVDVYDHQQTQVLAQPSTSFLPVSPMANVHPNASPAPSAAPVSQPTPSVAAEVDANAVSTPDDWGNVDLENSPGWELGDPPEPGQTPMPTQSAEVRAEISDLSLEPPPEVPTPSSE